MKVIAIQLANEEWYLPEIGEDIKRDPSGYYVAEKVGLHSAYGSGSFITHVWSEKDIQDLLIYDNNN